MVFYGTFAVLRVQKEDKIVASIYRKSALEKLSSPEQLDKAIVIVSPSFWIAFMGAAGIILVALVWSIFGRLPENVKANGIFMNRDGIHTVYSEVTGTVEEVVAYEGQYVNKGQVLARLSSDKTNVKIEDLLKRRKYVEAVTLTSENDMATDDNKPLLDLKSQGLTVDSVLTSNQYMLDTRKSELDAQKKKTASAKAALSDLEIKYFLTLLPVDTNKANISFLEAQTNLQSARNNLEEKKSSLLSLDAQYADVEDRYRKAKEAYEKADPASAEYAALKQAYEQLKTERDDYEAASDEYEHSISSWENVVAQISSQYEAAKEGYVNQVVRQESTQAWNAQISSAYQRALSDYNTEVSSQRSLEDAVLQLEAQIAGEEDNINKQNMSLDAQFDAAKSAAIARIDKEIEDYNRQVVDNSICSTLDGTIAEVSVTEGQAIQTGSNVARISQGDADDNVVVCYVPLTSGRKVQEGMTASIYPTTANKQEYGHMTGTVTRVAAYATSRTEVQQQVGLDSIVESFMKEGPVVEILIELKTDDSTASGYWWSNRRGAEVDLSKGTIITSDIIVQEKAPITMLIPYLKEKFTIRRSGSKNN